MSVPRPVIRLVGNQENYNAIIRNDTQTDVTKQLQNFAKQSLTNLSAISGYIFKSKSPSCGMKAVKIYANKVNSVTVKKGVGIFANYIMDSMPDLPTEEEGRLNDDGLKENFIERVFAHNDWQLTIKDGISIAKIASFHTRYKYTIMSHNYSAYQELGRFVAEIKKTNIHDSYPLYFKNFMSALLIHPSRESHSNTLFHILGYLKRDLISEEKKELISLIEKFKEGLIPLIVPMTFLHHFFKRFPNHYIAQQKYLNPYPEELGLRNVILP